MSNEHEEIMEATKGSQVFLGETQGKPVEPFEVVALDYGDLTEDQQASASNNGAGKEYANYICVKRNGVPVYLESDAMCAEDARFSRDLKWVKCAIEYAYRCGVADGRDKTA